MVIGLSSGLPRCAMRARQVSAGASRYMNFVCTPRSSLVTSLLYMKSNAACSICLSGRHLRNTLSELAGDLSTNSTNSFPNCARMSCMRVRIARCLCTNIII